MCVRVLERERRGGKLSFSFTRGQCVPSVQYIAPYQKLRQGHKIPLETSNPLVSRFCYKLHEKCRQNARFAAQFWSGSVGRSLGARRFPPNPSPHAHLIHVYVDAVAYTGLLQASFPFPFSLPTTRRRDRRLLRLASDAAATAAICIAYTHQPGLPLSLSLYADQTLCAPMLFLCIAAKGGRRALDYPFCNLME